MQRTALIFCRQEGLKSNPSNFIRYACESKQADSIKLWTKSLPSVCKHDVKQLRQAWSRIYKHFIEAKNMPGSKVGANSSQVVKNAIIALPNELTELEIKFLAKKILQSIPQRHPATIIFHERSRRGMQHSHFHLIYSVRLGGYGAVNDSFRMNAVANFKNVLEEQYSKFGFTIQKSKPGTKIKEKELKFLNHKTTVESRRNPRVLRQLAATSCSPRVKEYCNNTAQKIESKVNRKNGCCQVGPQLHQSLINQAISGHGHDTTRPRLREEQANPLTQEVLEKELELLRSRKLGTATKRMNL